MKLRWDNQHVRWGVTAFLVIAASMLFYYGVFHMKTLITGIQTFLGILTPIVYGVVIAFLLTPLLNFLEKTIIYPILQKKEVTVGKNGRKAIRWACVLLCMFLFLALIYALIMMVLPESNQQSITSGTRCIVPPHFGHFIVSSSIYGR